MQVKAVPGSTIVACDCCGSRAAEPMFSEGPFQLVRCRECQLAYVANPPERLIWQEEHEHYRAAADQPQLPLLRREVEKVLPHVRGGKWLDIGCGQGLVVGLAQERGFDAYGLEVDRLRAGIAQQRFPGRIYTQELDALGLPAGTFAVISALNVFSHLRSPKEFLGSVRRLLAPGGVLLLGTGEVGAGTKREHSHWWDLGDHLYFLGPGTLARYAAATGFEIVEAQRVWAPEYWTSREFVALRGRSALRNALKSAILHVPGAYAVFRALMLRRHHDNASYVCTFILRPQAE